MALNTDSINGTDLATEIKWKTRRDLNQMIADGSYSAADFPEIRGGLTEFLLNFNASTEQFRAEDDVAEVAAQGTLTLDTKPLTTETITIGSDVFTWTTGETTTPAQGTLTIDTQPIIGDTMTIGGKLYKFVGPGLAVTDGQIDIGTDLATAQANIVASINGTNKNIANELVTAIDFSSDDCVITAIVGGTAGNAIATVETFDEVTNVFDAATLGTTVAGAQLAEGQVGIGADLAASQANLVAAINQLDVVNAAYGGVVTIGAFATDAAILTAVTGGVAGNSVATTETMVIGTNIFDAATLGTTTAGVDAVTGTLGVSAIDAQSWPETRLLVTAQIAIIDAVVNP